jgi:hypothetical protein
MEKPKVRDKLASRGKRNRNAGHNYERKLAKEFRDVLGEEKCKTSRQASRLLDSCKVDLDSDFVNVQAKNVASNINYKELSKEIKTALSNDLPNRLALPTVIFHKKQSVELVVMEKEDFYKIIKVYKKHVDEINRRIKEDYLQQF